MDRMLPADSTPPELRLMSLARRARERGRSMVVHACALAALYVALAVGAPWLLREAPPDPYMVMAAEAACAAWDATRTDCTPALP